MQHIDIRRVLAERLQALLESQEHLPITPRPYQSETLVRLRDWLDDSSGNRRGYISQATGLGKTWLFSAVVSHCAGLRTLIIVPTKVLIEQTARFIVKFTGGIIGHLSSLERIRGMNGEIIAVRGHEHSDVVITTDESFIKHADSIVAEFGPHFIIWDECHWGYTRAAQQALAYFPEAAILGFSATPDYMGTVVRSGFAPVTLDNGQVLWGDPSRLAKNHFGIMINERTVRWGIENRWLAPFAWGMVECDIPLDQIPTVLTAAGMDYHEAALQAFMSRHWSMIVEVIRRLYTDPQYTLPERQVFAVCPSVKTAKSLAQAISALGTPADCVTGDTPNAARNTILGSFASGAIKLLTSVAVLREGWDAPNAEVCLMLRPTKSRVLYSQSMGRVLRPALNDARKVALVVDAFFQRVKFSPLSAPVLFGTPGQVVKERDILIRPKPVQSPLSSPEAIVTASEEEVSPYLSPDAKPRLVFVHPLEIEYWAGPDGTFEADEEKWTPMSVLAKLFAIDRSVIERHIKEQPNKIRERQGRDRKGAINTFFCVTDARQLCADTLNAPRANHNGTFMVERKLWASVPVLKKRLGMKHTRLEGLMRKHAIRTKKGHDRSGRLATFYCVTDVRNACGMNIESYPQARPDGLFTFRGKTWGHASAILSITRGHMKSLRVFLSANPVLSCRGRDHKGRIKTFYCVEEVKKKYKLTYRTNEKGLIQINGHWWGPLEVLALRIGHCITAIRRCVEQNELPTLEGRSRSNHRCTLYALSQVRKVCRDIHRPGHRLKRRLKTRG